MDPFINGIAWELQGKIATAQDKIIREKMGFLLTKARMESRVDLVAALAYVDTSKPLEVKKALNNAGFELQIVNYPPKVEFDGTNIKVDMDPPKIIIHKKVLEL